VASRAPGQILGAGVRKAYKSQGDDTTLSRFVKVKGERKPKRRQFQLPGVVTPAAVAAGRSYYHVKGVKAVAELPHVLVSGHNNAKIGRDVRKGPLRGYWIYTLSLEERATCGRAGILVRLHALGDFFSTDYVWFWRELLARHPRLSAYGYTARHPGTPIGDAIAAAKAAWGPRFAIRYSDGGMSTDCTVSVRTEAQVPADAVACPEQTGKTLACATCGFCWHSARNVAFVEH
jgi:hypothetical protein